MSILKTVILDCDGVMFESRNANREYYNFLLKSFGRPLMDEAELDFVHIHSVYDSVAHIFRQAPEVSLEEVHQLRQKQSYKPFLQYMEMAPDLIAFLETAREKYNLGIATNRTNTMLPLLKEFELDGYFGKVMTAENSRRPKPAADPLLEIIEHFACSIEEAIYIGDSTVDEETAENCGMRLISFKNKNLRASYHVTNFTEVLQLPPFLMS